MMSRSLPNWTAITALLLAGCEPPLSLPTDTLFSEFVDRDCRRHPPSPPPGDTPISAPTSPDRECWTQEFRQPGRTEKLDLLFVTDTSGSLNEERSEIAEGIDSFIRALPHEQDIRIGVMLGHGPDSRHSGRLWRTRNEKWVLSTVEDSREELRRELKNKLRWQASEWATDGGEMGMSSLLDSIRGPRLHEARAHGFFRTDAALAVVFISDENDICAEYPTDVERVFDPDRQELPAKSRYCTPAAGITAENLAKELKLLQQDRPLVVSGILYSNPQRVPRGLENEVGYGYLETIRASGASGFVMEMADGNFDEGLRKLGEFTAERIELQHRFLLAMAAEQLTVRVDGVEVEFQRDGEFINIQNAGREFSVISIEGCPAPEVSPTPTPSPIQTPNPIPSATPTVSPTPIPTPIPTPLPTPPIEEPIVIGV